LFGLKGHSPVATRKALENVEAKGGLAYRRPLLKIPTEDVGILKTTSARCGTLLHAKVLFGTQTGVDNFWDLPDHGRSFGGDREFIAAQSRRIHGTGGRNYRTKLRRR